MSSFRRSSSAAVFAGAVAFVFFVVGSLWSHVPVTRGDDATTTTSTQPDTSPSTQPTDIEALAKQLASEDWRQRNAAQDRLLGLGEDAEAVLKRLVEQTDSPEARSRAQDILVRLAERRWTGPSLVTMHRRGASLELVLDELFKAAGGTYVTWPPNLAQDGTTGPMDVDFDHKPFLSALKDVCTKAGLNARSVYDPHCMTLTREQMAPMAGPVVIDGPVLVSAEGVNAGASIHFSNPAGAQRSGSLVLEVLLEPRLHITHGWVEVLKMEDEKGKSLLPRPAAFLESAANANKLQFNSEFFWQANVLMSMPRDGTKIAVFRANLHLQAHARTERVEIRDVLKAKEVTKIVDGRRFTLHGVSPVGNNYEMHLTLYRDGMSPDDWAWFAYPYGRVRLVDADGHDLAPMGGGGGGGNESSFSMTLSRQGYGRPAPTGEPAAFVWELPLKTREIVVPVSFSDLPLP